MSEEDEGPTIEELAKRLGITTQTLRAKMRENNPSGLGWDTKEQLDGVIEVLQQDQLIKKLYEALHASYSHHSYCGFGDSWERECAEAQGLEDKITDALEAAEKYDPSMAKPVE